MKRFTKIFFSILFISFFSVGAYAQKVVLCSDYSSDGNPIDIYSEWDINPSGGYIYILYNQPNYLSASETWYLYIDKDWDNNGKYSAYETIPLTPKEGKKWIVYDYKFTEAGKYIASIHKGGKEQARSYFQINVKGKDTGNNTTNNSGSNSSDDEEVDTYYYELSEIKFCTELDSENKPLNEQTEFHLNSGSVKVKVYLSNDELPFKTNKLVVSIYKGSETTNAYKSFTVDIQPEWDYVSFNSVFTEPGTYFIDIYTEGDVYINTSPEITITR